MTDELITWLRQQLGEDERWALAANRPYEYVDDGAKAPVGGVHWRWVAGENWEDAVIDPVVDEFVAPPGWSCNLATVEEWPSTTAGSIRWMPRTYANEIIEMDASAAGHIARWDPARVLREVEARRKILNVHYAIEQRGLWNAATGYETEIVCATCVWIGDDEDAGGNRYRYREHAEWPCETALLLALPYSDSPGYREEWKP